MDSLQGYQQLIKQYLQRFADIMLSQPVPDLETGLSLDDEHGQYLLLKFGWPKNQWVRFVVLHVALKEGKIWIHEDNTEEGIATHLLTHGVPAQDIVLGFHPPMLRMTSDLTQTV